MAQGAELLGVAFELRGHDPTSNILEADAQGHCSNIVEVTLGHPRGLTLGKRRRAERRTSQPVVICGTKSRCFVGAIGVEPTTPTVSRRCGAVCKYRAARGSPRLSWGSGVTERAS